MARAPAMDPDERRAVLLGAARAVFARKGYHRAGVADIVDEVGVARGTFYRYFESKREVFQVVLGAMMTEVVSVVQPIDVTRPIHAQITENLDRLVRAITAEDVCRVLFAEAVGIDDEGDDALRAFYGAALVRIETALRTGQALGVVRPGDVTLRARALLGLLKEPVVQASLNGEELDAAALVEEIRAVLQGGILLA
jgi:AcrR family transcriptional regulator